MQKEGEREREKGEERTLKIFGYSLCLPPAPPSCRSMTCLIIYVLNTPLLSLLLLVICNARRDGYVTALLKTIQ